MHIDVLSLFPEMFTGVLNTSILKRAQERGAVTIAVTDFREYADNKHKNVDDYPFGGGAGMLLKPEPLFAAVEALKQASGKKSHVVLMSPQGAPYTHQKAVELGTHEHLILLCGHYEGFDERIREYLVDEEVSIGDYVLTGGELASMVVVDSVVRLLPEVIEHDSHDDDSFAHGLLEYPQYTRPADFNGMKVPDVLLSGHHLNIEKWRREQALIRTAMKRPDLLLNVELSDEEKQFIEPYLK
ncbi:tRNA (guanosine(37)-N1)-methyltransferase TrmD [Culicoidibacter larvae]|uniref:tRNA (guanine-N(1)-)-methyltransferase n=1 Tax=Culicoidibacter larvae TaxID=2579976 RepID=A0A5R8QFN6_9FIRM|nr:tRNA (guanosine(37)-N1)-methyltransferase TrmD [Culicoidibacter larvae]TLG76604.1 tRNA (guanosine(37)-N1)-methyltransferase TrmD [Culicoidibacter larvae]